MCQSMIFTIHRRGTLLFVGHNVLHLFQLIYMSKSFITQGRFKSAQMELARDICKLLLLIAYQSGHVLWACPHADALMRAAGVSVPCEPSWSCRLRCR